MKNQRKGGGGQDRHNTNKKSDSKHRRGKGIEDNSLQARQNQQGLSYLEDHEMDTHDNATRHIRAQEGKSNTKDENENDGHTK